MLKTALHTLDSWDLCHCTSRYNPIIIPGFLMEDSLHVHEQEAASCAPEFTRRGAVLLMKGLLHTWLWCMRGSMSFVSLQIDFCHFE